MYGLFLTFHLLRDIKDVVKKSIPPAGGWEETMRKLFRNQLVFSIAALAVFFSIWKAVDVKTAIASVFFVSAGAVIVASVFPANVVALTSTSTIVLAAIFVASVSIAIATTVVGVVAFGVIACIAAVFVAEANDAQFSEVMGALLIQFATMYGVMTGAQFGLSLPVVIPLVVTLSVAGMFLASALAWEARNSFLPEANPNLQNQVKEGGSDDGAHS